MLICLLWTTASVPSRCGSVQTFRYSLRTSSLGKLLPGANNVFAKMNVLYTFFPKGDKYFVYVNIRDVQKYLFCSFRPSRRGLHIWFYITFSFIHRPYFFLIGLPKAMLKSHRLKYDEGSKVLLKKKFVRYHTVSFLKRANSSLNHLNIVLPVRRCGRISYRLIFRNWRFQVLLSYDLDLRLICLSPLVCVDINTLYKSKNCIFLLLK